MSTSKVAISQQRILRACLIWSLAALFYFYDNLLQVSPSAMKPELSLAFVRDAEQFGSLSAYCLYAYGLMQIPAGVLMDRFGPRRILTLACLFCSVGSVVFGVATTLWEAKFGRVLIGVGASFAFVGSLKIISHWFPAKRFALVTGLTVTIGFLGAVFGLSTVSQVVAVFGWRHSMLLGGIVGLFLGVFLWLIVRDAFVIEKDASQLSFVTRNDQTVWCGLLQVIKHKQTWIAALYAGLMFVPTLAFGGLWGIPFLVEAHGFDRGSAGFCISLIYIGWVFGCPMWGFLSDYVQRRKLPMIITTIITFGICFAIIYLEPLPFYLLGVLLFSLGFFSSGFVLAFAVVQESNTNNTTGTAIGFTNAVNTFWGALAQPAIGKLLDMSATSFPLLANGEGERIFSLVQYQHALVVLPAALGIALCLLLFLKETFCKSKDLIF